MHDPPALGEGQRPSSSWASGGNLAKAERRSIYFKIREICFIHGERFFLPAATLLCKLRADVVRSPEGLPQMPRFSPAERREVSILRQVHEGPIHHPQTMPPLRRLGFQKRGRGRCVARPEKDPEGHRLKSLRQGGLSLICCPERKALSSCLYTRLRWLPLPWR